MAADSGGLLGNGEHLGGSPAPQAPLRVDRAPAPSLPARTCRAEPTPPSAPSLSAGWGPDTVQRPDLWSRKPALSSVLELGSTGAWLVAWISVIQRPKSRPVHLVCVARGRPGPPVVRSGPGSHGGQAGGGGHSPPPRPRTGRPCACLVRLCAVHCVFSEGEEAIFTDVPALTQSEETTP